MRLVNSLNLAVDMPPRGRNKQQTGHKPFVEGITRKPMTMRDTTYPENENVTRAFAPEEAEK